MNNVDLQKLKKRIYSVNAKILNMEKRYGKDSNIVKRAYDTIERIYGEGVTRYRMPKTDNLRELQKISRGVGLVEKSLYASAEGRRQLRSKAFSSFISNSQKEDRTYLTEVEAEVLYDIFEHATDWERIRDLAGRDKSAQAVDMIGRSINMGKNYNDIVDIMKQYMNRPSEEINKDFIPFFYEKVFGKK